MTENMISSSTAVKCLQLIEEYGPITASDLANKLGVSGDHEYKRRQIRYIVKELRECGEMICADSVGGYFKTKDLKEWQKYLDIRQMGAKKILAVTHSQMVTDSKDQGLLFIPGGGQLNNEKFKKVN